MKVLNISSLVLIAGMISCTIADEESPEPARSLPQHLHLLGYADTRIADIDKYDKNMCTRNGGPKAFNTHMCKWNAWEDCIKNASIIGKEGMIAQEVNGNRSEIVVTNATYERYCGTVPMLEDCFNNVRNTLKNCLDPEKKEAADVLYNVTTSAMHFMCANGAVHFKNLMRFNEPSESPCMTSKTRAVPICVNQTIVDYVKSKISDGASIGGIGIAQWLIPDAEKCSVMANFQTCIVKELNDCAQPMPGNLVDSIFNHVKTVTRCDVLVNIPKPTV